VWRKHENTDEVFIVLDGSITIQFRDEGWVRCISPTCRSRCFH
jgi:hypothetical protein